MIVRQGPRPPIEHEPSFQPLASAAARAVPAAGARHLLQIAAARGTVNPEVPVDAAAADAVVQLMSRGLDVRAQVERRPALGRIVSVVSDRQISGQRSLRTLSNARARI